MTLRLALDVGTIREHEFDRAQVSVGRGPLNDLVLNVEGVPKTLGVFVRQDTHYDWVCEANSSTIQLHRDGKIQFKNHNDTSRWTLAQGDVLKIDGTGATIEVISCDPLAMEPTIHHLGLEHRDVAISAQHARAVAAHAHPGTLLRALTGNVLGTSSPVETFITSFDGHEVPHRATWAMRPTGHEAGIALGAVVKARDPLTRLDRHTVDGLTQLEAGQAVLVQHTDVYSVYVPLGQPLRAYATFDYPPDLHDSAVLHQIAHSARELEPLAKLCFDLCDQQQLLASALEENRYFRERERRHYLFKELVVESPAMRSTFEKLNAVVDAPTPVMLVGESGTGKELLARALHHFCAARDGMLFRLNCAKTLDTDVDVEMFGCVASEFQGAIAPRKGVFELAVDGTVFLEEIDVLSPMIQGKLVRMLKEGEVRRVGDPVGRPVTSRLVASTNRPISELVESNKLRRDLYLLLKDNIIEVPPLRERHEDVLPLARTFLKNYAQRYGRSVQRFDEEVLERLSTHHWPGNVRELQLMVESAVLKCDEDTIRIAHLCA